MTARHRLSRQEVAKLPVASPAELLLSVQLREAGLHYVREFVFAPPRKFRADFVVEGPTVHYAWPPQTIRHDDLLIEVEGGGWVNGRHSRGAGMEADCEKSALAAIRGYRVMRVTPAQVNDGRALAWVRAALELEAA